MKTLCKIWLIIWIGMMGFESMECSQKLNHIAEVIDLEEINRETNNETNAESGHDQEVTKVTVAEKGGNSSSFTLDVSISPTNGSIPHNLRTTAASSYRQKQASSNGLSSRRYNDHFTSRDDNNIHYSRNSNRTDVKVARGTSLNKPTNTSLPTETDESNEVPEPHKNQSLFGTDEPSAQYYKHNISTSNGNTENTGNISMTDGDDKISFEEYERFFILNGIKHLLEQIFKNDSSKNSFKEHGMFTVTKQSSQTTRTHEEVATTTVLPQTGGTTTSQNRVDPDVIAQTMERLNQKDMAQLIPIFRSLNHTESTGNRSGHRDIKITDICCNIG